MLFRSLSQPDVYQTCCLLDFGVVAYFGEFDGGEVFYPRVDKNGIPRDTYDEIDCFEYKPERGDIVVHSAFDQYEHGVREVTSGIRYAFSNFSLKAEDNPGTFYNYGTPEYMKQIGYAIESKTVNDEIMGNWARPLKPNPQFSPEALKEMQASGLQGRELADAFFSNLKD